MIVNSGSVLAAPARLRSQAKTDFLRVFLTDSAWPRCNDRRRPVEAVLAIRRYAVRYRKFDDRCFLSGDRKWHFNLRSQKRRSALNAFRATACLLFWRWRRRTASNDNIDLQFVPITDSSVTSRRRKSLSYIRSAAEILAKHITLIHFGRNLPSKRFFIVFSCL